ncbi:MAG TPA: hypothetical protein VIK72_10095 [Clostridiaceae bacterium]
MPDLRFKTIWRTLRKVGVVAYILGCTFLIPSACLITKEIAEFISTGVLFKHFETQVYISLMFLSFSAVLIGIYTWVHNEKRYVELLKRVDGDYID